MTRLPTVTWADSVASGLAAVVTVAGLMLVSPMGAAARAGGPAAANDGQVVVSIPLSEPKSARDPQTVLRGTCKSAQVEVAFGALGMSYPDGIRLTFDGRRLDTSTLKVLARDITRPDLAYRFVLACSGTGVLLQVFAVSLDESSEPRFYEGQATISGTGKMINYHGLEEAPYGAIREVFEPR